MTFRTRPFFCFGLLLVGSACWSPAQEILGGIFGFYKLDLLGNSDTIVSIPFARLPSDSALVSSTNSGNVIQVQNMPNWAVNQFVYAQGVQSNTYYVRFESGALEGRQFDITSNGVNSLTVNLAGGSLAGAMNNNPISIVPHWTFGTVFANGNGVHLTANPDERKTEVLIPDIGGNGINLSAAATYYYYTNSGVAAWRRIGSLSTNRNDDVLLPNTYIIFRHNVPTNTTFISYGDVLLTKATIPLKGNSTNRQDNPVAMPRPLTLTLNESALFSSGAFVPAAEPDDDKDELLVFNNLTTNFNKSAAGTYYYYNSTWRKVGSPANFSAADVFEPGAGFIIRKAVGSGSTTVWTNPPTYTNN